MSMNSIQLLPELFANLAYKLVFRFEVIFAIMEICYNASTQY